MMKYEAPDQTLDLTQINETPNTSVLQSFNVTIRSRYGSAINYPREVIAMALKRVKRNGHQPSKYYFNISLKELVIYSTKKPEKVQIAVMHRHRRYACESRPLERSFSNANKYMIIWPDFAADTIKFTTTFFKNPSSKQFDNKEWTVIVEEITKKGKTRPLAAVQLNFAFFVNQNPNLKTELKLKLRSLQKDVDNCMLSLVVSAFVNEGHEMDDDLQSQAAYIPTNIPFLSHDSEIFAEDVIKTEYEDWKDGKKIVRQASLIKQAWNESSAEVADSFRKHSKTNVAPKSSPLLSDSKLDGKNRLVFPVEQGQRRKIVTSFEKNIINVENINDELQKIAERIKEVEFVSLHVQEKIKTAEPKSDDEQNYLIEQMRLINEKDALVRKLDYLNIAAEMNEVEEKLGTIQQKLTEVTDVDTTEERERMDDFISEYKYLIDKKNELAEILIQKEAEEEENEKFGRESLERSQRFLRAPEEPQNTSQRIIDWIKSSTTG